MVTLDDIREHRDSNDHTGAYLLGCEYLTEMGCHLTLLVSRLEVIDTLHTSHGYLSHELETRRYTAYQDMLTAALDVMSESDYEEFYMCF